MVTYTYEEIYSDPKKAIIRSAADANIVGLRNGQEVIVVCDRKWGEFTPEPEDYIDVLLYLRGEQDIPQSKSFSSNDYWWSCIQSQQSRTALQSFGVNVTSMDTAFDTGNGMILFDNANFNYELLGLYTDNGQTQVTADLSNFFVSNHSNQGDLCATIDSINAFSTPCLSWKLRIRKIEEPEETFTAYSRSASYQNANQTLSTISYATIYEAGSNNAVVGNTHKDYIITGMWNAAGVNVYREGVGLSCYLYSGNPRIRIKNNSGSDVAWNHIEYKVYDTFRLYLREEHDDYTLNNYSQMNNCWNRNNLNTLTRTANEVYTIIGAYKADGTPVNHTPLQVNYNSAFNGRFGIYNDGTAGPLTFAYVDFTVSGGDEPSAVTMSLDDED